MAGLAREMTVSRDERNARSSSDLAGVVERNIRVLLEHEREYDRQRGIEDRIADAITRFAGSMRFVYIHLLLYGGWIVVNLGVLPIRPFDPTFVVLAMVASVEAIFLSTFVLITQNRMAALADRRADLDLQISLLAEHEISRVIALVTSMADRMGIQQAGDPELKELARDVEPAQMMERIDRRRSEEAPDA
jgi:uncharacterized membrane protein